MANQFRYVRGDTQALRLPTYGSDVIEVGDLVWWDVIYNAVRNAETISGEDYATKMENFAMAFVGVAMEAKAATEAGKQILVATAGDFQFKCPTGAQYEVLHTVATGNGTAVEDQTVLWNGVASQVIGRVLAWKSSDSNTVLIRILSKANALPLPTESSSSESSSSESSSSESSSSESSSSESSSSEE